jgi:hypothetical protein
LVTIEGKWRPPALGPAVLQLRHGDKITAQIVGTDTVIKLLVPANTQMTIMAKSVFVPDRFLANGDQRELSVPLKVQQQGQ